LADGYDGPWSKVKIPEAFVLRNSNTIVSTKDFGDVTTEYPDDGENGNRELMRDDPCLITVIETMGEIANGDCASLTITEIPDDVKWKIGEYDGREWVEEAHRSW
jgi:hypothetical protein